MISCGIQWNPSHFIWKLVEYNDSISIFHWNPGGMEWNTMDSMWNTMIPWNVMDSIPFHSTWIPVEYSYGISIFHSYSIWNECGKMHQNEWNFSQIHSIWNEWNPYGIDTNSIWIPLECGGTVKTSKNAREDRSQKGQKEVGGTVEVAVLKRGDSGTV